MIPQPGGLFGVAAAAAAMSVAGTVWAIAHARRHGLLDQPGARRSHDDPTPRGGGIGIVLAVLAALAWIDVRAPGPSSWSLVAAGLVLVAVIGWWDDHRPLPALPRLLVHALAGACLAGAMFLQGAGTAVLVATLLLTVVLVNAWNFMDGINGLATSQALLCALGFAVLLGAGWNVVALALAAACLAFLPFNFPKARVFLGDVGSGGLGYMVAALLAAGFASRPWPAWPLLLLPPVAMLVDTGLTLMWRIRRGEHWWEAHVQHAFQRWARERGHVRVALGFAGWTFAAVALMLAALLWPSRPAWGVAPAGLLASAWAWRWLHRRYAKNNTEGFGT